jgi:FLVCR family MFS transporter 7
MEDLAPTESTRPLRSNTDTTAQHDDQEDSHIDGVEEIGRGETREGMRMDQTHYRVYKRRWFGLCQLVLLNIVVSWDVSCFIKIFDSQPEG